MREFFRYIWESFLALLDTRSRSVAEPASPAPIPEPDPVSPIPAPSNEGDLRIGKQIVDFEARRDKDGGLIVYHLPSGDGGGAKEIAGINSKYHPQALKILEAAPASERENIAAKYIEDYTLEGTGLRLSDPIKRGTLFFVLDTVFNRGPRGGCIIVQNALRGLSYPVIADGKWGPKTRGALFEADREIKHLPSVLRKHREQYERNVVGYRAKFWKGLTNRWNNALEVAKEWNAEETESTPEVGVKEDSRDPVWLDLARAEIGQKEIKGSKHNPRIVAYWHDAELNFKDDETPWCAGFVGAMLERAGVDGTGSGMARSYEKWGKKLSKPAPGAVVTFWRGSKSSGSGHVGFYEGKDKHGNLMILGGNQSDAVNIKPFSRDRLTGFWWPKDTDVEPVYAERLLDSDGKVSTNER